MTDAISRGNLLTATLRPKPLDELWFDIAVGRGWKLSVKVEAQSSELIFSEIELRSPFEDTAPPGGVTADDLRDLPMRRIHDAIVEKLIGLGRSDVGRARLALAGLVDVPTRGNQRSGRPRSTRQQIALNYDRATREKKDASSAPLPGRATAIRRARKAGIADANGLTDEGKEITERVNAARQGIECMLKMSNSLTAGEVGVTLTPGFGFDDINAAVEDLESDGIATVSWKKGTRGGPQFDRVTRRV